MKRICWQLGILQKKWRQNSVYAQFEKNKACTIGKLHIGKSCKYLLKQSVVYDTIIKKSIVLQGGLTFHFNRMGVMPMKNHYDFKDIMTFGLFLLALLTFVFTFCK